MENSWRARKLGTKGCLHHAESFRKQKISEEGQRYLLDLKDASEGHWRNEESWGRRWA